MLSAANAIADGDDPTIQRIAAGVLCRSYPCWMGEIPSAQQDSRIWLSMALLAEWQTLPTPPFARKLWA